MWLWSNYIVKDHLFPIVHWMSTCVDKFREYVIYMSTILSFGHQHFFWLLHYHFTENESKHSKNINSIIMKKSIEDYKREEQRIMVGLGVVLTTCACVGLYFVAQIVMLWCIDLLIRYYFMDISRWRNQITK